MIPWFHPSLEIDQCLRKAARECSLFDDSFSPEVRPAESQFGDFQANGILAFAKKNRSNPREIATQLLAVLNQSKILPIEWVKVAISGPGFINFTLTPVFLTAWLSQYHNRTSLQSAASQFFRGKTIVVDYPSPNTAKQMHIGHLRPMVIGESIQRLLRFCGGKIIRDNHIGDWGTNFGILIMAIKEKKVELDENEAGILTKIEKLYQEGVALTKQDKTFLEKARHELVTLQKGDAENLAIWNKINKISNSAFQELYDRFKLEIDFTLGESFYRDKIDKVYEELTEAKIAEKSDGALVVFHPGHPRFSKEVEKPQPFIIRKQDGASNYASTDLATIAYRCEKFSAYIIIYVTDSRQRDHFEQLFLTAKRWFSHKQKFVPMLKHVWFGTILGDDGKAIKTKSGAPIKLKNLLDEAVQRAYTIVSEKNPDFSSTECQHIAEIVGVNAVRYADLMQNRSGDYIFAWNKLLNFDGNSAPYLLMAVARIHSIFRKTKMQSQKSTYTENVLETETEMALARKLIGFPWIIERVIDDLRPHLLCNYLYELACVFSHFYNTDKVIISDPIIQNRRLILCSRTLNILETGLDLLGLETLERM